MGSRKMVSMVILLPCVLASATALGLEDIADVKYAKSRDPKLFFVSISSTTSSVSTGTVCYVSTSAGVVTCGKKRKRSVIVNGDSEEAEQIQPSSLDQADSDHKLESGRAEDPTISDRDARFLLYWLTTTSTSTTIYTGTSSIGTLDC